MAISAAPSKGRVRESVRACLRGGETACRAWGGGGGGRGRRSAPVCGSEREAERCRQPPAFPAARSCEARSESLLGPVSFSGGGLGVCHSRLGGGGVPPAGALQRNRGLVPEVSPAVERRGRGAISPGRQ